jgi:putative tryptophan/tyrosine transport system substrate-binding protein
MRRRDFIKVIAGAAAGGPRAVRAQQPNPIRQIGMLVGFDDPDLKAFQQELRKLGWLEGRNIHIEQRYAPAGAQVQALAQELVALRPDVIFAQTRPVTAALQKVTQTVPIVFAFVIDPIGAGFVASVPRPGGNITGFMVFEPGVIGKWLEMLKEIAPETKRVALLGNPKTAAYYEYLQHAAEAGASSLGIKAAPSHIENDAANIERTIVAIASTPNSSLTVLPDSTTTINRDLIIKLAARHRLPAIYNGRVFVAAGGLMSYGFIYGDQYRQAAFYVDRILRGAKPSDLPVQSTTKYETILNLKTAKDLGLTVPDVLLVAADDTIE